MFLIIFSFRILYNYSYNFIKISFFSFIFWNYIIYLYILIFPWKFLWSFKIKSYFTFKLFLNIILNFIMLMAAQFFEHLDNIFSLSQEPNFENQIGRCTIFRQPGRNYLKCKSLFLLSFDLVAKLNFKQSSLA